MKNFFNHDGIRKQMEYLNIITGITLIVIGAVYALRGEIDYFASWFIFGCMYIVMDCYTCMHGCCSHSRVRADYFKYAIGILAMVVSVGFLIYIL